MYHHQNNTSCLGIALPRPMSDRAACMLQVLPAGEKFVFEFRDASWYCEEVYEVLREHDCCLAITHCTG